MNDEIIEVEEKLRIAQLSADVVALDDLIDNDLLFAGPDGSLATKAQDLESHRAGVVSFRKHEPQDLKVRRVTDTVAVASLRTHLAVEVAGVLHEGTFRYTRVWSRGDDGKWRVVAGHVSEVAR